LFQEFYEAVMGLNLMPYSKIDNLEEVMQKEDIGKR
jgi:hypothetical protein